jgi:[acyl-carrier-protein] S-malonyltransferase
MKTALLFPGQGSQKVGMGQALAEAHEPARRVFEEADEALGFKISELCFEGPKDKLVLTQYTQPAILTTSIAALRAAEAEAPIEFDPAAGHSLGEWSALVAVGALELADAVRLVHLRGRAMQEAVPEGEGAMAALMGLDEAAVRTVCEEAAEGRVVQPANLNGGGQIVISGHADAVDRAIARAKEAGAKRAIKLPVSAPFHCALMQPAAERVAAALADVTIHPMTRPVVANVTAEPSGDAEAVRELLTRQVTSPVRWEESARTLAKAGVTRAVELGAGAVLAGLLKRAAPEITVTSVGEPADISKLELAKGEA